MRSAQKTILAIFLAAACYTHAACEEPLMSVRSEDQLLFSSKDLSEFKRKAGKAITQSINPVKKLKSAGVTDKTDPEFIASRVAFKDADNAAISALAFKLFNEPAFFAASRDILLQWAEVNIPTGHPIDETRLEGLVWAYSLVCSAMTSGERNKINKYFTEMQIAKRQWKFGSKTQANNHKTHQLKMLLLLDRVLGDSEGYRQDVEAARKHLQKNIVAENGMSKDYIERKALYYQFYNLEAWLEIELIAGCCSSKVNSAFWFSANKVLEGDTTGEFIGSSAEIDEKRGNSGFKYAKTGGRFDKSRSARSIITYATLSDVKESKELPESLLNIAKAERSKRNIVFFDMRRKLWNKS